MKKLIALIALVVLCGTIAFAATDNYSSANQTGTTPFTGKFTATVYCIPALSAPTSDAALGNFFTGTSQVATNGGTQTWNLTGPATAAYTVSATTIPALGLPDDGATGAKLIGSWSNFDNATVQATIGCSTAFPIVCTPTFIVPGSNTGAKTWTLTVSVTATI